MRLQINHPDLDRVDTRIFTVTFTPDCLAHQCRCREEDDRRRDDACCQYGADVLLPEKAAILRRAPEIASVLIDQRRDPSGWFDERDPERDPDAPSGIILRTATADLEDETSGCVFLLHTGERGCGLHRAALQHGFGPGEIKPMVCRLYPLARSGRVLGLSPDFSDYSCANDAGPTVYRLMRDLLAEVFGAALVRELDRIEAQVARRKLRVLRAPLGRTPVLDRDGPAQDG